MLPDATAYLASHPDFAAWLAAWLAFGGSTDVTLAGGDEYGSRYLSTLERSHPLGTLVRAHPMRGYGRPGDIPADSPLAPLCREWVVALAGAGLQPNDWGLEARAYVPADPQPMFSAPERAELDALWRRNYRQPGMSAPAPTGHVRLAWLALVLLLAAPFLAVADPPSDAGTVAPADAGVEMPRHQTQRRQPTHWERWPQGGPLGGSGDEPAPSTGDKAG